MDKIIDRYIAKLNGGLTDSFVEVIETESGRLYTRNEVLKTYVEIDGSDIKF